MLKYPVACILCDHSWVSVCAGTTIGTDYNVVSVCEHRYHVASGLIELCVRVYNMPA